MTTEDEFQTILDTTPHDWQTRLILADWLEEHNDRRAEGYRQLGMLKKYPSLTKMDSTIITNPKNRLLWVYGKTNNRFATKQNMLLPWEWFNCLPNTKFLYPHLILKKDRDWEHFLTRKEAEDTAALAFIKSNQHAN